MRAEKNQPTLIWAYSRVCILRAEMKKKISWCFSFYTLSGQILLWQKLSSPDALKTESKFSAWSTNGSDIIKLTERIAVKREPKG